MSFERFFWQIHLSVRKLFGHWKWVRLYYLFLKVRAAESKFGSADPFGERFSVEQCRLGVGKELATVTDG